MMYEKEQRLFDEKNAQMLWFVQAFFVEKQNLSILTKLEYVRDFEFFFNWLYENNIVPKMLSQLTIDDFNTLTINHFRYFFESLEHNGNGEATINRKIGSLRSFFTYLYKCDDDDGSPLLKRNLMSRFSRKKKTQVSTASKIYGKILAQNDEREQFLKFISTDYSSEQKLAQQYYEKNKERDLAIISFFLYSGIRLCELVSLNLTDVDFDNNKVTIIRRNGGEYYSVQISFEDEAQNYLKRYLAVRNIRYNLPNTEQQ